MTHTPGPWELEAGRCFRTQSGTFYLAYGSDPKTSAPHFKSPTELDANARLIAAAPDLLAALEGILIAYIQELSPEQRRACKGEKSTEDIDGNVREARAAIARAKEG